MARRRLLSEWIAALFVAAAFCGMSRAAESTDHVGDLGAPDRLVIRGLDAIDPERLRRPLVRDFEIRWLARPGSQRAPLLDALARKARQALATAGFATAEVVPTVESIDGTEKIVLDVGAGPRFGNGAIDVEGLDEDLAARLKTFLTTPRHPESAIPEIVDGPDGNTDVVWRGSDGKIAAPSPALWRAGCPVTYNDWFLDAVRALVTRFLEEEGYLVIAPPAERGARSPVVPSWNLTDPGVEAAFDITDGRNATLVVSVARLPPRARLTRIDLPRSATTTPDEIAAFLGIELGAPVSQRDRIAWLGKLRDSGRFFRHGVELIPDPLDPEAVVATFDIDEYAPMMPLSRPLSREEETMLRGRRWFLDALDDPRDLVIDVARSDPGKFSHGLLPLRATLSATDGMAIFQRLPTGDVQGCVMTPQVLRLVAPGGVGWFDLPAPHDQRFTFLLQMKAERVPADKVREDDPHAVRLSFGMGINYAKANPGEARVGVGITFDPLVAMVMLHHRDPAVRWEDDLLVVDHGTETTIRVEARTGRVLSLAEGGGMTIEQRGGALAEAERLATSAGTAKGTENKPFSSLLHFLFVDGGVAFASSFFPTDVSTAEQQAECDHIWDVIRQVVRRCVEDDAFAALDRNVVEKFTTRDEETESDPLGIPHLGIVGEFSLSGVLPMVAAWTWVTCEEMFGGDAWPTAAARLSSASFCGGAVLQEETMGFFTADRFGPLAHLVAALACGNRHLAADLAERGLDRCTLESFREDVDQLLVLPAAIELDRMVSSILRGLDEPSLRLLGEKIDGDPDLLLSIARTLRADHDARQGGLHGSLDALWENGLGDRVTRVLRGIADSAPPAKPDTADAFAPFPTPGKGNDLTVETR